jgi:hypothetical protein
MNVESLSTLLKDAYKDAPNFRSFIHQFSIDLEQFQKFIEACLKAFKFIVDGQEGELIFLHFYKLKNEF